MPPGSPGGIGQEFWGYPKGVPTAMTLPAALRRFSGPLCCRSQPRSSRVLPRLRKVARVFHPSALPSTLSDSVVLLGNLPPRDVLAAGIPDDVRRGVQEMLAPVDDRRRIIISCGGGAPPGVSTENLEALGTA